MIEMHVSQAVAVRASYFMTLLKVSDWLLLSIPSSKDIEAAAENFLFNKIFSDSVTPPQKSYKFFKY